MTRSLHEQAYEILRERIATGMYPPGTYLSENSLAAELELSRTPLRAAIERLQAEGVLERRPRIGTFVRIVEPAELEEIYEIRLQLETLAARRAATHISDDELSCLQALVTEMAAIAGAMRTADEEELLDHDRIAHLIAADLTFHQVLVWASGNRWIHRILDGMHVFSRFFGLHRHRYDRAIVEHIATSHATMVAALARHDADAAEAGIREHLETGRARTFAEIRPAGTPARGPVPLQLPGSYLEHVSGIPALQKIMN